jgi:prepilin-type N-terminal cleavage/methylation domain-containing protein
VSQRYAIKAAATYRRSLSRHSGTTRNQGFTLLELVIAIVIFTVAVGALARSLMGGFALGESTKDRVLAMSAIENTVAKVSAEDFTTAFYHYNSNAADDPLGAGSSVGSGFAILSLEAIPGDVDGLAGEIMFPGNGTTLREDVVDLDLGMPRDLNGDGVIDGLDHSTDYTLLPVRIQVSWTGADGVQELDLVTTIVGL